MTRISRPPRRRRRPRHPPRRRRAGRFRFNDADMCDRPPPKAIQLFGRRRRGTGGLAALALMIALAGGWLGCSSQSRYRVLSVFFDGVPDPNAKPVVAAQEQEGTTAKPT